MIAHIAFAILAPAAATTRPTAAAAAIAIVTISLVTFTILTLALGAVAVVRTVHLTVAERLVAHRRLVGGRRLGTVLAGGVGPLTIHRRAILAVATIAIAAPAAPTPAPAAPAGFVVAGTLGRWRLALGAGAFAFTASLARHLVVAGGAANSWVGRCWSSRRPRTRSISTSAACISSSASTSTVKPKRCSISDRVRRFWFSRLKRDVGRHADCNFAGAMPYAFLLDRAQGMQRRRFDRADAAGAGAMRADFGRMLEQGRTQPLTRHLQQAERRRCGRSGCGRGRCAWASLTLCSTWRWWRFSSHVDEVR